MLKQNSEPNQNIQFVISGTTTLSFSDSVIYDLKIPQSFKKVKRIDSLFCFVFFYQAEHRVKCHHEKFTDVKAFSGGGQVSQAWPPGVRTGPVLLAVNSTTPRRHTHQRPRCERVQTNGCDTSSSLAEKQRLFWMAARPVTVTNRPIFRFAASPATGAACVDDNIFKHNR